MNDPTLIQPIQPTDLRPGDVLLSLGVGDLSEMICLIDGGRYSHAALWTGNRVVHATLGGIVLADLEGQKQQKLTDVYRYTRDGHPLGSERWPSEPVIERAERFVGGRYAYSDLVMLAMLIGYGRRPRIPVMETIVRRIGAHAADGVTAWFQDQMRRSRKAAGQSSPAAPDAPGIATTCTELVGTAFYEAESTPPHAYALEVVQPGRHDALQSAGSNPELEAQYASLAAACRDFVRPDLPLLDLVQQSQGAVLEAGPIDAVIGWRKSRKVVAGDRSLPLSTLTPRDLQTSPTLVCVGRLS